MKLVVDGTSLRTVIVSNMSTITSAVDRNKKKIKNREVECGPKGLKSWSEKSAYELLCPNEPNFEQIILCVICWLSH